MRIQKRKRSTFSVMMAFAMMILMVFPTMAFAEGEEPPAEETPAVEETTDTTADGKDVDETSAAEETAEEPVVEEDLSEIIEALSEADVVLVDEGGEVIPLASEEAAEVLAAPDPWFIDPSDPNKVIAYQSDCTGWAPPAGFTSGICHTSATPIQSAVDNAPTNATVYVEKGTFVEQITINKNLTLQGAGMGESIIEAPNTLSALYTISGRDYYPIILAQDATVNIDGFTIDGLSIGNGYYRFEGIAYLNADGAITNNEITNIQDNPPDGSQHGVAIDVRVTDGESHFVQIDENKITNFQKNGMALNNTGLVVEVTNNNVSGSNDKIAGNAIQLSYGATGTISGNTIGYDYDEWYSLGPDSAEYNYWGCDAGPGDPICDSVLGSVDYDPWLIDPDGDFVFGSSDGTGGYVDNCPDDYNPDQLDTDGDGIGDVCDSTPNGDDDGDGIDNLVDNCPTTANPDQSDTDTDGIGDVCDACPYDASNDADGDGVCGDVDNCPNTYNPGQDDIDVDGIGDSCDTCPTNSYYDSSDLRCTVCADGSQPNTGQTACEFCPAGSVGTNGTCSQCADGYVSSAGATECTPCPVGSYETGNTCVLCAPGTYAAHSGSAACTICPPGQTSEQGAEGCYYDDTGGAWSNHPGHRRSPGAAVLQHRVRET